MSNQYWREEVYTEKEPETKRKALKKKVGLGVYLGAEKRRRAKQKAILREIEATPK